MDSVEKNKIKNKILYESLIGKKIEIINSKNKLEIGISGMIIFESQYEFHIKTNDEIKKITKKNIIFNLKFDNIILKIDGKILVNSLCERLKKKK